MSADNGPASRELARAVADDLLQREPYRSYGVTLDEFFRYGSGRMHEDLIGLNDRTWGWDDDYGHLSSAGREAIRAHPWTYARNVARDFAILLRAPLLLDVPAPSGSAQPAPAAAPETIVVNRRRLPKPSEGDLIPAAHQAGLVSDAGREHRGGLDVADGAPSLFRDPADARHARELDERMLALGTSFPDRGGNETLARTLNTASRLYPRAVLLLLVGIVALLVRGQTAGQSRRSSRARECWSPA